MEQSLRTALDTLVTRGTLTTEQRSAILAEVDVAEVPPGVGAPAGGPVGAPPGRPAGALAGTPGPERRRRSLADVLVEVGLYVGSALVLAAAAALVAQSWEDLTQGTQVAILATTALVTAVVGVALSRGAVAGSARRRLAGVVLVATAASAAATVGLLLGDREATVVAAFGVALLVMVVAQIAASSAVTEVGMFVAAFALLQAAGEWIRPEAQPTLDEFGFRTWEPTTVERLMPLGSVAFGLVWAGVVARRLMHRELAVALGMLVALASALALAGDSTTRPVGLATLAVLAAVGFWRFMVEARWPWLAAAIASVTAFVFWAVGGGRSPALAFLVAGLVLLGSSALAWQVARRRRTARALGGARDPMG